MAIPQSKNLYEPCSIAHFEAPVFPVSGVNQGHSTSTKFCE